MNGRTNRIPLIIMVAVLAVGVLALRTGGGAGWPVLTAKHGRAPAAAAHAPSGAHGNVRLAQTMAARQGWTGAQWGCLHSLWGHESAHTWSPTVTNPYSGAYGIVQALPAGKLASAGANWRTSARTQIRWGLGYIRQRWGSPCGIWHIYCVNTPSHPDSSATGCWY